MSAELQREFMRITAQNTPLPPSDESGIFLGVPADVYHRRQARTASKTALDKMERSPAHYHAWLHGHEGEPTHALLFGRALHAALLEPKVFASSFVVLPDFGDMRSSNNRDARDRWLAERGNPETITADDERAILGMLESVMKHPAASRLIAEGVPEVSVRWRDEQTGLACKARADYWVKSKRLVVDVKTTEDASVDAFAKSVAKWGYHRQDALYRAGFAAVGERIDHFALLAVEKAPPYAVSVYVLDEEAIALGFSSVRRDMDRLAECVLTNSFPGYYTGINTLSLPRWAT